MPCRTTKDWHSCTWKKASIESRCPFVYAQHTYEQWKPLRNDKECDTAYRRPTLNLINDKTWEDQCGKNNRECTITISKARLSDKGVWYCIVEPCEMIKGIGCTQKGDGANKTNVTVQVRCINKKY